MSHQQQEKIRQLESQIAELNQTVKQVIAERDKTNLLYKISAALSTAVDFDAVASTAISFAEHLGATSGGIYLLSTDTGETYFKNSFSGRHTLDHLDQQSLVHQVLTKGLEAWVLENDQAVLIPDTQADDRWLRIDYFDQEVPPRACICSPISVERGHLWGAITFVHPQPNHFTSQDLALLEMLTVQVAVALENTTLLEHLQSSLHETNLIAEASQQLVAAATLEDVYAALVQSAAKIGAERCALYMCDVLDVNDVPKYSEVVEVYDVDETVNGNNLTDRFAIFEYPFLEKLVQTQESIVIPDILTDNRFGQAGRQFLSKFGIRSATIISLISRSRVIGLLFIQHRRPHRFHQRELALYHTICNQSIVAIENARQMQLTEIALTETQTLYRAGRVLAGTTNLEEILQESLYEFLYSLNLDQGGITLLSPDRQFGELLAYVQNGQAQRHKTLRFSIDETVPYQQALLSGQPFQSYDVLNDPRLEGFQHFNKKEKIKSLLQAPMIIRGETVGWIGADSVQQHREFSQREIDLARAMADQIAITIQNRRLLERSERQTEQLKAVAQVGKAVAELTELDELLSSTVDLIRDQFGFYHVSIFLVDEAREWAVVRASTGEVGRIMVERPHRLKVGSKSIVGYVTAKLSPRVALDVGEDRVHFDNPLLPETHSEMALPMILREQVIGALDVQSTKVNAFGKDDVETLQIMADQLTSAIENARLFEQTDKNLRRTQSLYHVSEALAVSADLRTTFETVLGEYLNLLNLEQGSLMLVDRIKKENLTQARYINGQPVEPHLTMLVNDDLIFKYLQENRTHLVIEDVAAHPLIKDSRETRGQARAKSMLFIPIFARGELVGSIVADATKTHQHFSENDIKIGETIADQLGLWLENRRLLEEAHHRSELLQTAAEVSQAASSVLEPDQLIEMAVNFIRDKFSLYYVGLFLVDGAREWAVLRAGTGEAGRQQLEIGHRLAIGGGSMIGWSIENRKARIASDVGTEDVHFKKNKYLPDTRSEMALPLVSRDEVIGALTVQSVERSAFSDEDISLLQTMADQLANAIENAHLFENATQAHQQAEQRLGETIALQQLSQKLSSTLQLDEIVDIFLQACKDEIGFDYVQLALVDEDGYRVQAIAGIGISKTHIQQANCLLSSRDIMADIIRTGQTEIITGWDDRFNKEIYEAEGHADWIRLFMPIILRRKNIGLVEAGFNQKSVDKINDTEIRLLRAFINQTVIALDNTQRYEVSRRAARREEIIRQISGKIRNAVSVDDILKTTVTELSKVVGASQGSIALDMSEPLEGGGAGPA